MRSSSALRSSTAFPVADAVVLSCLLDGVEPDDLFRQAWHGSLADLPRSRRRGALPGAIGHIAESVIEIMLAELGFAAVWHFTGPGGHGVDLLMLAPSEDHLVAIEVKGTLRAGRVPRLTASKLAQMSAAWLNKRDNPGMREWSLTDADIYGVVAAVNFADKAVRLAVTSDFHDLSPITALDQLIDVRSLSATVSVG